MNIRTGRASDGYGQFFKAWKRNDNLKAKLRIFNAVVVSTLCYDYDDATWLNILT